MSNQCRSAFAPSTNLSVLASTLLCNTRFSVPLETRYVYDVGSGTTKSKKVLVDTENGKIVKTIQEVNQSMGYQKCISESPSGDVLTKSCMNEGVESLMKILKTYGINDPKSISNAGIATAWARNAKNIEEYMGLLKEHGFNFKVISQQEEGEIGYKSADSHYMPCDAAERVAIVWDIGGGSYQLSVKEENGTIYVHHGEYGSSNFKKSVNSFLSSNYTAPVGKFWSSEAVASMKKFAKEKITDVIKQDTHLTDLMKGKCVDLIGIGQFLNSGVKGIFGQSDIVHVENIERVLEQTYEIKHETARDIFTTRKPEFIDATQQDLIMTYSIMKGLDQEDLVVIDAKSVDYVATEESFWSNSKYNDTGDMGYLDDNNDMITCLHRGDEQSPAISIISYF